MVVKGSEDSTWPLPSFCLLHSLQACSRCLIGGLSSHEVMLASASSTSGSVSQALLTPALSPTRLPYFVPTFLSFPFITGVWAFRAHLPCPFQEACPDYSQSVWSQLLKDLLRQYLYLVPGGPSRCPRAPRPRWAFLAQRPSWVPSPILFLQQRWEQGRQVQECSFLCGVAITELRSRAPGMQSAAVSCGSCLQVSPRPPGQRLPVTEHSKEPEPLSPWAVPLAVGTRAHRALEQRLQSWAPILPSTLFLSPGFLFSF